MWFGVLGCDELGFLGGFVLGFEGYVGGDFGLEVGDDFGYFGVCGSCCWGGGWGGGYCERLIGEVDMGGCWVVIGEVRWGEVKFRLGLVWFEVCVVLFSLWGVLCVWK